MSSSKQAVDRARKLILSNANKRGKTDVLKPGADGYLPGCGEIFVSWLPGLNAIAGDTPIGTKNRRSCQTCGMIRKVRSVIDGLSYCSSVCAESRPAIPSGKSRRRLKLPDQSYLQSILDYDPITGFLYWKPRPGDEKFNRTKAGKRAFTSLQTAGYHCAKIDGKSYLAHRIIWKLVYGVDPDVIDHINRVKGDDRLENLRSVTQKENLRNVGIYIPA